MNKYQEVYDYILTVTNGGEGMVKEMNIIRELVEKSTPKKVVDIDTYIDFEEGYTGYSGICPTCREWCYDNHDSYYCGGCGQAISWSQEEEE